MKTLKMLGLCGAVALAGTSAVAQAFEHQVVLRHGSECMITSIDASLKQASIQGVKTTESNSTSICPFTTKYHIGTPDPADRDYHPENMTNANIFGDSPITISYICVTDQLTSNYVCKKGSRLSKGFWTHSLPQNGDLPSSHVGNTWPYDSTYTKGNFEFEHEIKYR